MPKRIRLFPVAVALIAASVTSPAPASPSGMDADELAALVTEGTIAKIQAAVFDHRASCAAIVRAYLDRIARLDAATGLNAISALNPAAIGVAKQLDAQLQTAAAGPRGALFCVPILVKDNIDTRGLATTGGSVALAHNVPTQDAFIVRHLEAAGAIVLAKTNMAEWAFSPRDSVSSSHGVTANAYDRTRTPAGSSGGTASGIAASLALAGLGTDTGNSVRGPSGYAALVGMRPTLGLVSRDGIIPLELDRDTAGPITRTVEDNARVLSVIAGSDPADPLTQEANARRARDYTSYLKTDALQGARIGVVRELVSPAQTDPHVLTSFNAAIETLRQGGATIIDPVSIPNLRKHLEDGYYCPRFAFDVNTYLNQPTHPQAPREIHQIFASGAYSPHTRGDFERFLKGSAGDPALATPPCAYYLAHPGRRAMLRDVEAAMSTAKVSALIYPTWLSLPPTLEQATSAYRGDNSQLLSPPTGMPAITVPSGFANGLPMGLQILGRRFDEGTLYALAYAFEQKTHWRQPPKDYEPLHAVTPSGH
ncbi:MAG TPA: amidase family protein [Steroidobacteraceae bacterium]